MDPNDLVHAYLDDSLDDQGVAALACWIKASPENARRFASEVRLHDRLRDLLRDEPAPIAARPAMRRARVLSGVAASLLVGLVLGWWSFSTRLDAATELNRLIERSERTSDRTYVVHSLDAVPEPIVGRQPPIDGATLHVRRPDQYVLVRRFEDGRTFVTGSDGERSWAVPPEGAVRSSGDPLRFRGPLPGHQYGIPFADLRFDLVQLREAYDVSLLNDQPRPLRGLLARKKSNDYRGPKRVKLWYDPADGVVRRMVFEGMPRARGGPDAVEVDLVDRRDLGIDFFGHARHHDPGRRVVDED